MPHVIAAHVYARDLWLPHGRHSPTHVFSLMTILLLAIVGYLIPL